MTTSYILEAQKKLKAEKKKLRMQEAIDAKAAADAEEIKHQANLARIAKKMAIINGEVIPEEKPKKVVKKKAAVKKKPAAKKPAAKKPAAKKKTTKKKTK